MIPKIIHYCWFGRNPLPESAIKCINSWKKYFPNYEIKEWNEDNFDVNIIPYTTQAYSVKKYAFVSDYARYWILHKYGGVYFDTDVEVIQSMEKILNMGAFMGCEIDGSRDRYPLVAPGLGMAIEANNIIYKQLLDKYADMQFIMDDGSFNTVTIVRYNTDTLIDNGLIKSSDIQKVLNINIYPKEYFNPYNNNTGVMNKTKNTYSIHWYYMSWLENKRTVRHKISQIFHRLFGEHFFAKFRR